MDLSQAEWLVREGVNHLSGNSSAMESIGRGLLPWQSSLLRAQKEWLQRSRNRFPDADKWLWTERSLAQASDWWSAVYKASLFPSDVVAVDGCCGAGADLAALAARGPAIGIDRDEVLVALARYNLQTHSALSSSESEVVQGELPRDLNCRGAAEWLHVDPDRRAAASMERRLRRTEDYSPSLNETLEMVATTKGSIIKLAPASIIEDEIVTRLRNERGLTRCWLGNLGECRQQLLLTGAISDSEASRVAVLCEPNCAPSTLAAPSSSNHTVHHSCDVRTAPLKYIYDCHAVLHAAELQSAWASGEVQADALGSEKGYFTSDVAVCSEWASCFEVVDLLPWDERRVRRWLREHKIGEVEVKKRLLQLDANATQRQLRGTGDEKITLLITRLGDRTRAVAARRIAQGDVIR